MRNLFLIAAMLFCGALSAQSVGKVLPASELSDLTNTKAKSLSDYSGRAMLLEFFAYT
jgi:hypothetical protein